MIHAVLLSKTGNMLVCLFNRLPLLKPVGQ